MMTYKLIGIIGGFGSYAGIDLINKVYDLTEATSDQEHLPVSMLSVPHIIIDRTKSIPESCVLVHLIEEVGLHISTKYPEITKVGVLGTTGTILEKYIQRY